jgi:hypothetical protein
MSAHTISADRVAAEALKVSHAAWALVLASGLPSRDELLAAELILETLSEKRGGNDAENTLWFASAVNALPQERRDATDRKIVARRAGNAWSAYVRELEADEADQVADYSAERAREDFFAVARSIVMPGGL